MVRRGHSNIDDCLQGLSSRDARTRIIQDAIVQRAAKAQREILWNRAPRLDNAALPEQLPQRSDHNDQPVQYQQRHGEYTDRGRKPEAVPLVVHLNGEPCGSGILQAWLQRDVFRQLEFTLNRVLRGRASESGEDRSESTRDGDFKPSRVSLGLPRVDDIDGGSETTQSNIADELNHTACSKCGVYVGRPGQSG